MYIVNYSLRCSFVIIHIGTDLWLADIMTTAMIKNTLQFELFFVVDVSINYPTNYVFKYAAQRGRIIFTHWTLNTVWINCCTIFKTNRIEIEHQNRSVEWWHDIYLLNKWHVINLKWILCFLSKFPVCFFFSFLLFFVASWTHFNRMCLIFICLVEWF